MTAPQREYREPPPLSAVAGFFCQLEIAALRRPWFRIVPDVYAQSFYASKGSRFTPLAGDFPCAYFAEDPQTCFAELFGDAMARHAKAAPNVPFAIAASHAAARGVYRITRSPALRLCDLTDGPTLLSLQIDLSTVYALDLKLTQTWAEFITKLDSSTCAQLHGPFDGIRYLSRHTGKVCQVLWDRPAIEPVSSRMEYARDGTLLNAPFSFDVAKLCGTRLSFPDETAA